MISKKICMVGAFSVGKTSLVKRYVYSIFSDTYLSSVGVKISKKTLSVKGQDVNLVLWDMEGKDEYNEIAYTYLRGAMGIILVSDGTRRDTLDIAIDLSNAAHSCVGEVPHLLLINKSDIHDEWEVSDADIETVRKQGVQVMLTSAKTGEGVEEAFACLAEAMLKADNQL